MVKEFVIDAIPVSVEELSPADFIKALETKRHTIVKSAIVPPRLGEKGFGKIRVEYDAPLFKPAFEE